MNTVKGRPFSEDSTNRIRKATMKLLRKKSLPGISLDEIALLSGSSKSTIYRRWHSLEELCADSFFSEVEPMIHFDETGRFEDDLFLGLTRFGAFLNGPWGKVFRNLVGAAALNQNAANALKQHYYALRWKQIKDVLLKAQTNGELDPNLNVDNFIDRLFGPLFYKFLIRQERIEESYCEEIIMQSLRATDVP